MHVNCKELHLFQVTIDNLVDNVNNFNELIILHFINRQWLSFESPEWNEVHSINDHSASL
jgi:hypothetical protein